MYNPRSKLLPSGFAAQTFTSNNWTDANVDYLYSYFNCCYADITYEYIKNLKRGSYSDKEKCQHARKISFFKTGLDTLKYWHNQNSTATSASTTITTSFAQAITGNTIDISVYVSPSPLFVGSLPSLPLIGQVSGYSTFSSAFAALQTILQAAGFNLNVISIGLHQTVIQYTSPSVYGNFTQYLIVNYTQTGPAPYNINSIGQFSGGTDIFNSCISLEQLQCLVEKMESVCGCFGCKNTSQITQDNYYVSVGQTISSPPTPVALPTNQIPK